jgi:hypothetical protein
MRHVLHNTAPNKVRIDVLRNVTNRILDFIERDLQMESVELPHNFYWSMSDDVLYELNQQPQQLDCGSLIDDLEFVTSAHENPSQAIPLVLMHVAPLLKALSTAVPSYKPPKKAT